MSGDVMNCPDTVDKFIEQYKIVDTEQIYTNGAKLIPAFRMKQWCKHFQSISDNEYSKGYSEGYKDGVAVILERLNCLIEEAERETE